VLVGLLTARFALGYDQGLVRAIQLGVFHAVSAFNNAGFAPGRLVAARAGQKDSDFPSAPCLRQIRMPVGPRSATDP
jgi:hypothetical protein